ncbi:MAG: LemA family protein [Bacteroidales bacterium]|jgi:LemA protein|nr:LemA family protein [Bacteroidales bacterium]OQC04624.1 MAG: LemA family protein [Bacteroidetes bacterium ADurb.Bin090]MBP8982930.1 LemA family protein [Bacteroidales bacterium]HNZ80305.1 LemA family protein [Bacteroidales bacterium]HOD27544.1 LemA family protein [Bacteroidales bacterium]
MAKSRTTWIILIIVVLIGLWLIRIYNSLVTADENVSTAWSQVENVYQRRLDLIPNLVNTVQGAADFERNTLNEVIQARAAASSINLDAANLNEANLAAFQQAQDGLGQALSRLMVVVERYPELKANQNFRDLQSQLEGTENRIAVERNRFNEAVRIYNTSIRRFPKNVIAGIFGFEARAYFQAEENAQKAPQVQF